MGGAVHMPPRPSFQGICSGETDAVPMLLPDEIYCLYRRVNNTEYEFRWVDDRPALRDEIQELRRQRNHIRSIVGTN